LFLRGTAHCGARTGGAENFFERGHHTKAPEVADKKRVMRGAAASARTIPGHSPARVGRASSAAGRRSRAVESFRNAADTIGPVHAGMSVFAITRGQFSMIDAISHVLDAVGRARVSVWTWTIAEYEVTVFEGLRNDGRIADGLLVIDGGAREKNAHLIRAWGSTFGRGSVRYVRNHSKIATVEGAGLRVLLRGSMNLNLNPRFEQLDVTEGGADFELVRRIESELPVLEDDCTGQEVYQASQLGEAFGSDALEVFRGVKVWAK